MAQEDARSVRERGEWLEAREAKEALAQVQGEAQTTAERYTDGATEHPGVVRECDYCLDGDHLSCIQVKALIGGYQSACLCFERDREIHVPGTKAPTVAENVGETVKRRSFMEAESDYEGPAIPPPVKAWVSDAETEPTKQRPGDQQLPRQREGEESVQDRIIDKLHQLHDRGVIPAPDLQVLVQSMEESKRVGKERYGTALQTFNDRDTLEDAIQEARDLFVYLSAMQQARDTTREGMIQAVVEAVRAQKSDGGLNLVGVAEIAVDTIFGGAGGPVRDDL
ncbi:MAG: hypothetical protein R3330_07005 [Saprospiraceae bacterium]|nr:hypothetical protein [Saprospiraceae bacterium]